MSVSSSFASSDCSACLEIFDLNCPQYFAPNEREQYLDFLFGDPVGYKVWKHDDRVIGCAGLSLENDPDRGRISWIMLHPDSAGSGLGRQMMDELLDAARERNMRKVDIAASQYSAGFFARFSAQELQTIPDGWGQGIHRIDMLIDLEAMDSDID